jgi:hypothetical protein
MVEIWQRARFVRGSGGGVIARQYGGLAMNTKLSSKLAAALAAVCVAASPGHALAAGIRIDPDGRQASPAATTQLGWGIDPNGRQGAGVDPDGLDAGGAMDPNGGGWISHLLHRWFGWF